MRFSERIGKRQVKCEIQVDSMDADLRNRLWSVLYICIFEKITTSSIGHIKFANWANFFKIIWFDFYKLPVDRIDYHLQRLRKNVRSRFFESDCWEVYDLIEYIAQLGGPLDVERFKKLCNEVLEKELSAYRFIGNELSPITDKVEIAEIEEAIEKAAKHKFKGVRTHLESALAKLSDRKEPDYRNCIKESISAVESLCIIISKDPKASLGKALKLIEDAVGLHPALKSGFSSIYGYTSDEGGIRHAMIDDNPCDSDDAKYMLVSCSAFVNYLIMKANKAGLIE